MLIFQVFSFILFYIVQIKDIFIFIQLMISKLTYINDSFNLYALVFFFQK